MTVSDLLSESYYEPLDENTSITKCVLGSPTISAVTVYVRFEEYCHHQKEILQSMQLCTAWQNDGL